MHLQSTNSVVVTTHCLVYGPAKSGKTRLIPTCPQPIVCSTDDGLSSIRQHNIPFANCRDWKAVKEFVQWSLKSSEAKQFQTIVFDDLTEACEQFLYEAKPRNKNLMQAFGELNDAAMELIRQMRDVRGQNVVFLCKQEKIKDEMTGGMIYGPMIPGKAVAQSLPYLLGEVYNMTTYTDPQTNTTYEVLRTKRNNAYDAGSRSGKLAELELADLGAIFKKVVS